MVSDCGNSWSYWLVFYNEIKMVDAILTQGSCKKFFSAMFITRYHIGSKNRKKV